MSSHRGTEISALTSPHPLGNKREAGYLGQGIANVLGNILRKVIPRLRKNREPGFIGEMMKTNGEHMEGMVSISLLSLAHRYTHAPGGLLCQPVFASVGIKRIQKMKAGCEGQGINQERDKQSWRTGWMVSERLSLSTVKLSMNSNGKEGVQISPKTEQKAEMWALTCHRAGKLMKGLLTEA